VNLVGNLLISSFAVRLIWSVLTFPKLLASSSSNPATKTCQI
jgi:hypothetical protein